MQFVTVVRCASQAVAPGIRCRCILEVMVTKFVQACALMRVRIEFLTATEQCLSRESAVLCTAQLSASVMSANCTACR